jgi:hypothetical protein
LEFQACAKIYSENAGAPPLGLLTVAAMLLAAWEKRLVDLNVTGLTLDDLAWAGVKASFSLTITLLATKS